MAMGLANTIISLIRREGGGGGVGVSGKISVLPQLGLSLGYTTLIFHSPINDHGYNYDISEMQMALIEESQVLIGQGEVKVCFMLEMRPTSFPVSCYG